MHERNTLVLLLLLFLGYTALSLARRALQSVYVFMPPSALGPSATTRLGMIISSQTLGYTVSKLISGVLIDQANPCFVFVSSLLAAGCSLFLMSLSSNWIIWMVLYLFNGVALGMSWPAVAKLLRTTVKQNELATWWGIISASTNLAGCVGPWITMLVLDLLSSSMGESVWRANFLWIGWCCLVPALLLVVHCYPSFNATPQPPVTSERIVDRASLGAAQDEALHPPPPLAEHEHREVSPDTVSSGQSCQLQVNNVVHRNSRVVHSHNSTQTINVSQSSPGAFRIKASGKVVVNGGADGSNASYKLSSQASTGKISILAQLRKLRACLSPRHRNMMLGTAVVHLSSTFLRFVLSDWLPVMLHDLEEHYSRAAVNLFISAHELGGISGNLLAGIVSDRNLKLADPRWPSPRVPYILIQMVVACLLLLFTCLSAGSGLPLWTFVLCGFLLGATVFGAITLCGVLAVETPPPSLSGTGHAFTAFSANIGALLAGYPFSKLGTAIGWSSAFVVGAVFSGASIFPLLQA